MMARRGVLSVLAGGTAFILSGCGLGSKSSYRFKMIVEVDTPTGLKTGSSVYEVTAANTGSILPEGAKRDWAVKGEAVAVDVGPDKTLFALLKTGAHFGDMMGLSMSTLYPGFRKEGYDVVNVAKELGRRRVGDAPTEVARANYPMLVTFDNIDDPKSVKQVEPDTLATSFGEGVKLKSIAVQSTDDPVSIRIKKRLKWLSDHPEPSLNPDHGPRAFSLAATLKHGSFRQGTTI